MLADNRKRGRFGAILAAIRKLMRRREPELPDDPYARVTAPKKPRPPYRSASAVAEPPE